MGVFPASLAAVCISGSWSFIDRWTQRASSIWLKEYQGWCPQIESLHKSIKVLQDVVTNIFGLEEKEDMHFLEEIYAFSKHICANRQFSQL